MFWLVTLYDNDMIPAVNREEAFRLVARVRKYMVGLC